MECYDKFKSKLAALCERGKITREVKKRFGAKADGLREAVFAVGSAMQEYFPECEMNDEGFAAVCDAATDLFACFAEKERAFALEAAVIGAYVKLMREFNARGGGHEGKILKERAEKYFMALQNIKRGLRLFDIT